MRSLNWYCRMYSNEHNQSRLRMLKSKEEGVQKLLSESHHRLAELTKDTASYKNLLKLLVVQVSLFPFVCDSMVSFFRLLKLLSGTFEAPGRKGCSDLQKARYSSRARCITECSRRIQKENGQRCWGFNRWYDSPSSWSWDCQRGRNVVCVLVLLWCLLVFAQKECSSGGVVMGTPDGKIICSNTLDARLAMAFETRLPEIRRILYGESLTRVHKDWPDDEFIANTSITAPHGHTELAANLRLETKEMKAECFYNLFFCCFVLFFFVGVPEGDTVSEERVSVAGNELECSELVLVADSSEPAASAWSTPASSFSFCCCVLLCLERDLLQSSFNLVKESLWNKIREPVVYTRGHFQR